MHERVLELDKRRQALALGGGAARIEKQHAAGKLSARERIDTLLDPDSFQEPYGFAQHRCTQFGMEEKDLPADGVVTGCGSISGRLVHVASQDFTVAGGAAGEVHCDKIVEMMHAAMKTGSPFIFINDSGGARIQEGIDGLAGYGRVFYHNTLLSGVVPQISLICGPCAGGATYSPALTDFIIQTLQAQMFITGPTVIKQVTGQVVSAEELGGPEAHMRTSGVVHFVANDDRHAIEICKQLLSFLPSNNLEDPPMKSVEPVVELDPSLNTILPENSRLSYDMHDVIQRIVDDGDFLEVQALYAENMIVGFGRVLGRPIGIIANQPLVKAGCLDIDASDKASRFIRFCNAFNMPLVTLADVPGFMPGTAQEYGGIIKHGAKLLYAYAEATVPKITLITRKAYGGAYDVMASKHLRGDVNIAWPSAEIAVMGPKGAVEIIFRKDRDDGARIAELTEEYRSKFANPFVAGRRGYIDDVITRRFTRKRICRSLAMLRNKKLENPWRKHGNIPL